MHIHPESSMLVSVHASLGKLGWAAHVTRGKAALIAAATRPFAAIFVDFACVADGMSGPQIARALRRCAPDSLVYLLSDQPDPAQRMWARSCGARDVLSRDDPRFEAATTRQDAVA
ncbi:MAG: response regulator [Burkholderiales bacterium]|jgi:DNA-binding response OmpR family regulator|nr:response regulator [Burkholderiales bacterium]